MKRPSYDQLSIAQDWLDANEGEGEEGESCKAVAEWLRYQMGAWLERSSAKSAGVPVHKLRAVIRRSAPQSNPDSKQGER